MTRRTAFAAETQRRNEAAASRQAVAPIESRSGPSREPASASGRPNLRLAGVSAWTHTLSLTGELNHRSAHMLEAEIERLGEEGVDRIILDLRRLKGIDATGVAVIAFRCELCKRRGNDFALIRGPRSIQREYQYVDLFPDWPSGIRRLLAMMRRELDRRARNRQAAL